MMNSLSIPGTPSQGWVVLIGGGEFSFGETREIDEFLLARMPEGNGKVAFVPAGSGSNDYAIHYRNYLVALDSRVDVVNVPIYRRRDSRREKNLDLIRNAGLVYIGAGVTNRVVDALLESPALDALDEVLARGGVVAAIGAGAAALGVASIDMERIGSSIGAVGWIPGAVIETGFTPGDDRTMRMLLARPEATVGIGIPPKTALAIAPDRHAEIVGEGQVAIVRKPG